ncbi:hypothetical protein MTO96_006554 [Rhipicephalus appendiculatus]
MKQAYDGSTLGDIAEIFPDGTLKILDSKNQQVKLQSGECAWLGLVEEVLRMCPLVHNVLAYGSPKYAYLVALVEPNYSQLQSVWLDPSGGSRYGRLTLKKLCEDDHVTKAATRVIQKFARESGKLQRSEVPLKVKLCADKWGPDKGLGHGQLQNMSEASRRVLQERHQSSLWDDRAVRADPVPPKNIMKKSRACLARRVEQDRYAPYWRPSRDADACVGVVTLDELARQAIAKWPLQRCLGSRPVLHRTEKIDVGTDKIVKKSTLGDYRWLTYHEVDSKIERISRGLLLSGVGCGQCLAILVETSQEWFLMAQACFRINAPLLTLRTSMGDVGIICAMNETSATHLVTSDELLPRVRRLVRRMPSLTVIVCIETADTRLDVTQGEEPRVVPFSSLERLSAVVLEDGAAPTPDDVAVVAYTSGSHGAPRGVVATHGNIVAAINGLGAVRRAYCGDEDIYIAYLELAHVFELVAELLAFGTGTPIGYSSARTLTDASTGLAEGCKGRLCEALLEYAVEYKTSWSECGFDTPLLDIFIFNNLRRALGSRLRVIVCSSAPLSTRTRRFALACLCCHRCHVIEANGTTETCAMATVQDIEDKNV